MTFRSKLATALALSGLMASTATASAPQRRKAISRAPTARPTPAPALAPAPAHAPANFDPKTYAASIAGIDCANAASRVGTIVPIQKALRGIATRYSAYLPLKGEFESTDAFYKRVHDEISSDLGGTDRIVAVIPLRDIMKYDADTSVVTINPVVDHVEEHAFTVKAYSDIDKTGSYSGSNAYGVTARVTRETFTQFFLLFPARGATTIRTSMAPDAAQSLKENGSLVFVGSLLSPYIADERAHGRATVSDPTDTTYLKFYLGIFPQCAIVVNGGQEIGRLGI